MAAISDFFERSSHVWRPIDSRKCSLMSGVRLPACLGSSRRSPLARTRRASRQTSARGRRCVVCIREGQTYQVMFSVAVLLRIGLEYSTCGSGTPPSICFFHAWLLTLAWSMPFGVSVASFHVLLPSPVWSDQ
jgi:hypothetical protein